MRRWAWTTVRRWSWRRLVPQIVTVAVAVSVVVIAVVVVKWGALWLASTKGLPDAKAAAEERGRVRTALLAVLAGSLAALGAYYTHRTFGLNRAGQITERFTRAIDQLGRPELDVRLGGIYALDSSSRRESVPHRGGRTCSDAQASGLWMLESGRHGSPGLSLTRCVAHLGQT